MRTMLAAIAAFFVAAGAQQEARPLIRSETDLPPVVWPVEINPSALYLEPVFAEAWLPRIRAESEQVLRDYDVDDPGLRADLELTVALVDLMQGRPADAERRIVSLRARESKPQLRAIGYLSWEAIAAARALAPEQPCSAAASRIAEGLVGQDPDLVRDEVTLRWSATQNTSTAALTSAVVQRIDPGTARRGALDLRSAITLVRYRAAATLALPCAEATAQAWRTWLDQPENAARDIWTAREPGPAEFAGAGPVTVAIWDTGFDLALFPGQLAVDPAEPPNGQDDDGNGVVDDATFAAWDHQVLPTAHAIAPPSAFLAPRVALDTALFAGYLDLEFGRDTASARFAALRAREGSTEDQAEDYLAEAELSLRLHGTAVASVVADGAPYVRLFPVRLYPGGRNPEPIYADAAAFDRYLAAIPAAVSRMRRAGARVANLSWDFEPNGHAATVLEAGLARDEAEARRIAFERYDRLSEVLYAAISGAPEILFVVGAANANRDDEQPIPSVLDLPNILVVAATNRAGAPTDFTNTGPFVDLYALGQNVPVRYPGDTHARAYGTSFSAPMTARAAAQMLAVNPGLSTSDIVEGLTATATTEVGGLRLIHPARAVQWARGQ